MKKSNLSLAILNPLLLSFVLIFFCQNAFSQRMMDDANLLNPIEESVSIDTKIHEFNGKVFFKINVSGLKEDTYLIVERSVDGETFEDIGLVKCIGNNAPISLTYSFVDEKPLGLDSYYRLVSSDSFKNTYSGELLSLSDSKEFFSNPNANTKTNIQDINNEDFFCLKGK